MPVAIAGCMRAVVQHGPRGLGVEEGPAPQPGPGKMLMSLPANGINDLADADRLLERLAPAG